LDDWLAGLGTGGAMALVAFLLGLRHATNPDHLTAVSTLFLSEKSQSPDLHPVRLRALRRRGPPPGEQPGALARHSQPDLWGLVLDGRIPAVAPETLPSTPERERSIPDREC